MIDLCESSHPPPTTTLEEGEEYTWWRNTSMLYSDNYQHTNHCTRLW